MIRWVRRALVTTGRESPPPPPGFRAGVVMLVLAATVGAVLLIGVLRLIPPAIYFGGVAVILLLSAWLLPPRVLRERAGRRLGHCVECGYDLRGSVDGCPECGAALPEELARRRRIAEAIRAERERSGDRVDDVQEREP